MGELCASLPCYCTQSKESIFLSGTWEGGKSQKEKKKVTVLAATFRAKVQSPLCKEKHQQENVCPCCHKLPSPLRITVFWSWSDTSAHGTLLLKSWLRSHHWPLGVYLISVASIVFYVNMFSSVLFLVCDDVLNAMFYVNVSVYPGWRRHYAFMSCKSKTDFCLLHAKGRQ